MELWGEVMNNSVSIKTIARVPDNIKRIYKDRIHQIGNHMRGLHRRKITKTHEMMNSIVDESAAFICPEVIPFSANRKESWYMRIHVVPKTPPANIVIDSRDDSTRLTKQVFISGRSSKGVGLWLGRTSTWARTCQRYNSSSEGPSRGQTLMLCTDFLDTRSIACIDLHSLCLPPSFRFPFCFLSWCCSLGSNLICIFVLYHMTQSIL